MTPSLRTCILLGLALTVLALFGIGVYGAYLDGDLPLMDNEPWAVR